ncbi:MFS transporter [Streptomyces sp. NPDC058195]|uniref:MFS transporter n=1 Tax=Streptomyces sp. NPDC058195 TaxID=3346375 RepID=UPI0036EF5AB0
MSRTGGPLPRLFVAAMIVDALGSGMFMPFALLYFVRVQDLTVGSVGATLTATNVALIVTSAALGSLVQRVGTLRSLLLGNAVRAPLFAFYVVALPPAVAMGALVLSAVLDKAAWVSLGATIARLARGAAARRAFSLVSWARNIGLCLGSLVGGLLASSSSSTGLRAIALVNAVSFAATAVLLLRLRTPPEAGAGEQPAASRPTTAARPGDTTGPEAESGARGGLGDAGAKKGAQSLRVLRLPGFALLSAAKTCFTVCATVVSMFTGIYLLDEAQLPGWAVGTVLALNGALVVLFQQPLVKRTADSPAPRMMALGGVLYAVAGGGFALVASLGDAQLPVIAALVAMTVYTLGEIVIAPASDGFAADLAEPGNEAPCMAVYQASWSIASVVVPAAGAWLLLAPGPVLWVVFAAVALVGALLSAALEGGRARQRVPA